MKKLLFLSFTMLCTSLFAQTSMQADEVLVVEWKSIYSGDVEEHNGPEEFAIGMELTANNPRLEDLLKGNNRHTLIKPKRKNRMKLNSHESATPDKVFKITGKQINKLMAGKYIQNYSYQLKVSLNAINPTETPELVGSLPSDNRVFNARRLFSNFEDLLTKLRNGNILQIELEGRTIRDLTIETPAKAVLTLSIE